MINYIDELKCLLEKNKYIKVWKFNIVSDGTLLRVIKKPHTLTLTLYKLTGGYITIGDRMDKLTIPLKNRRYKTMDVIKSIEYRSDDILRLPFDVELTNEQHEILDEYAKELLK